ncbi:MAG: DNA polymerase Y family protein [Deltaproteobacteria bacterium]|nr:DNA polymerase Y family protein [Deltaproteobacteria bacterium]
MQAGTAGDTTRSRARASDSSCVIRKTASAPARASARVKTKEYACILAPALPLQALVRSEPDLANRPVATLDGRGTRAVLAHVSRAAGKAGARPGMTPSQARSIAPDLVLRTVSPCVLDAAHRALTDVALAHSPRVQSVQPGVVVLEVSGTQRSFPSWSSFGCVIQAACRKVGLAVRVAVASGPRIACIAARACEGVDVIPFGREAAALAPLPIRALAPSPALVETLSRLGVRTVGGFARLNGRGIGIRLGPEAMDLHRLARGEDSSPLHPIRPCESFEESVSLDYLLDNAEPLVFLLSSALERLAARLKARLMAPCALRLSLDVDPAGRHEIAVRPPAPTHDIRSLLTLVRVALEASPPPGPVAGFTLGADGDQVVASQGHLFGPPMPEPTRLARLMNRLSALAGPENVGTPSVLDGHRRDPSSIGSFAPKALHDLRPEGDASTKLAFSRFNPPLPVRIRTRDGVPVRLDGDGIAARIVHAAGPWYAGADWWAERPQAGAFYDAEVRGRGIYRLWHDLLTNEWFLDGEYD